MSLSSLLVQREVATMRHVEEALARQVIYGGDLATNLLEVARVDEARLLAALAESFGLTAAPPGPLPVADDHARALVPRALAIARGLAPIAVQGERLVVAVSEPLTAAVEAEARAAAGMAIEQHVALFVRVRAAIARVFGETLDRRLLQLLPRLAVRADSPPPADGSAAMTEPHRPTAAPPPGGGAVPTSGAQGPTGARLPASPFRAPAQPPIPAIQPGPVRRATSLGIPLPAHRGPSSTGAGKKSEGKGAAPAASAARPARRRRGPMTLDMATKELDDVVDRDALLDLLFDFARQYFDYVAVFIVHGDIAEGREAHGPGASRERVVAIGVPLDMPSVLATARERRVAVISVPSGDGLDAVLLGDLQRPSSSSVLVAPVVVRSRAVALLYGDNGEAGVEADACGDVISFVSALGPSLEQLIVRRKLGAAAEKASATARAEKAPRGSTRPASSVTTEPPSELATAADRPHALQPAEPVASPPVWPPPSSQADARVSPLAGSVPDFPRPSSPPQRPSAPPAPPYVGHAPASPVPPPPPTVAVVRRPIGPPIPREEPPDADDVRARKLLDDLTRSPGTDYPSRRTSVVPTAPTSEMAIAVPPHRPPSSHTSPPSALPSVIIDSDDDLKLLVESLVARGGDEGIEAELIRRGHHAMPALMAAFPGPIAIERVRPGDAPPRVAECGAVLRVIAGQRRVALPFVLAHVEDADAERRYWATLLLTELAYPEAITPLVGRLSDDDPRVRRAAKHAARAVYRTSGPALVDALARIAADASQSNERRIATIDTLVDLRAGAAVPALIDVLGGPERDVAVAACNGLALVTLQDFVLDVAAWRGWWEANAKRHRVEWLIDALMHESLEVRRDASIELRAITKEYFGYSEDLPDRERARAQQRYRDWWVTEGRTRFARK